MERKKKIKGLLFVAPAFFSMAILVPLAQAYTVPTQPSPKQILYNGKLAANTFGLVSNDTTYMPIWYVMNTLQQIGIQSTWDALNWNLQIPANYSLDLTNIPNTNGSQSIALNGTIIAHVDGIKQIDPGSGVFTEFMPIWYVQQALNRLGIPSTWDGTTWNIGKASSTTSQSEGSSASTSASTSTTTNTSSSASTASFSKVDLRYSAPNNLTSSAIDQFLTAQNSPLAGLGSSFISAQNTYGVDANYLVSHAILESYWGKSKIALAKNNLFGYGAYDADPGSDAGRFPSDDYAIRFQAWEVRNNYLEPDASLYVTPTLQGMNTHYATDPQWASSIGSLMKQVASYEGDTVASYHQYTGDSQAPSPQSRAEPVFYLSGASGVAQTNPFYGGVPYYTDMGTGMERMFAGPLKIGNNSAQTADLQQYLNQQINAGLQVDGQFGPATQKAVKAYQASNGLSVTGECDYAIWSHIDPSTNVIPANSTISVDQIMQGMAGGYVVEWYHVVGYGWVDAQYVQLTNAYRAIVADPKSTQTTIPVYDPNGTQISSIHSGDVVVASNPTTDGNGFISIEISDQVTGQPINGKISTADASLVPQS